MTSGGTFSGTWSPVRTIFSRIFKQCPGFTSIEQDWYYKGIAQIVFFSKPAPDHVQFSSFCFHTDANIGSQVLKGSQFFDPHPVRVNLYLAVANDPLFLSVLVCVGLLV